MGLPGQVWPVPEGKSMWCEDCGEPAVKRVQGETDSFGCEMHNMCQACYDKYKEARGAGFSEGFCTSCNRDRIDLLPERDYDEGHNGPVYYVCGDCRRESTRLEKIRKENAEEYADFSMGMEGPDMDDDSMDDLIDQEEFWSPEYASDLSGVMSDYMMGLVDLSLPDWNPIEDDVRLEIERKQSEILLHRSWWEQYWRDCAERRAKRLASQLVKYEWRKS